MLFALPAPTLGQWRAASERIGRAIADHYLAEREQEAILSRFIEAPITTRLHLAQRLNALRALAIDHYGDAGDEAEAAAIGALLALRRRDPSFAQHIRRLVDIVETADGGDYFGPIVMQVARAMRPGMV